MGIGVCWTSPLKLNKKEESPRNNSYEASSLFTKGKEVPCVFCGGKGHYQTCQVSRIWRDSHGYLKMSRP